MTRYLVLSSLALAWAVSACDATDSVTNRITCGDVCERYRDCFDEDYDVDGCTDRCENAATANEDRARRLEICDACIDDRSCTEATFNCSADCAGIVP
jgi:hypothetical protein